MGGVSWAVLRDREPRGQVSPISSDEPEPAPGPAAGVPSAPLPVSPAVARPAFEREAVGDGAEVLDAAPRKTVELRVVKDVGADGNVSGSRLRDVIVSYTGVAIRYRTEAIRAAFLDGAFRVPLTALLPADDPPGAPLLEFVDVIRQAGFDVLFRDPVVVVGARTEPGQAPPPPPPPPSPRPEGSPDGPR